MKTGFFKTLAVLAAWAVAMPAAAQFDTEKLFNHMQETKPSLARYELSMGAIKKSEIPGFDKATVTLSRRGRSVKQTLYISKDRRYYTLGEFQDLTTDPVAERLEKIKIDGAPIRGDKDAPVTLVNYTDFQCPYCRIGFRIMRDQIMKEYDGKVRWVYKSFPLRSIHPWAGSAAVAAECASKQSRKKFWKFHDSMFENQAQITKKNLDDKVVEFAKEAGLDSRKFKACYEGQATLKRVREDEREAASVGIRSTPSFMINGRLVAGADPDGLKRMIDLALKKDSKN